MPKVSVPSINLWRVKRFSSGFISFLIAFVSARIWIRNPQFNNSSNKNRVGKVVLELYVSPCQFRSSFETMGFDSEEKQFASCFIENVDFLEYFTWPKSCEVKSIRLKPNTPAANWRKTMQRKIRKTEKKMGMKIKETNRRINVEIIKFNRILIESD